MWVALISGNCEASCYYDDCDIIASTVSIIFHGLESCVIIHPF